MDNDDQQARRERGDAILNAVLQGKPDRIHELLRNGADLNVKDKKYGWTPLHVSVRDPNVIRVLLDHGADPNAKDSYGRTPLHRAAEDGSRDVIAQLLEKGANLNAKDGRGRTPLLSSHDSLGHSDKIQLLLEKGADPNVKDKDERSRLNRYCHGDEARVLLEHGADPNAKDCYGRTPLHTAAYWGATDTAQLLLEKGVDPNARDGYGKTPLHSTVKFGRIDVARLLLEKGADLNVKDRSGETVLHAAISYGNFDLVKLLLEKGADPNAQSEYGREEDDGLRDNFIRRRLLQSNKSTSEIYTRCNYDRSGETALYHAILNDNLDMVKLLLEKGADPNARNGYGHTSLRYAFVSGRCTDMVRLLLEKGADPNTRDKNGHPPYHNLDMVEPINGHLVNRAEAVEMIRAAAQKAGHAGRITGDRGTDKPAIG